MTAGEEFVTDVLVIGSGPGGAVSGTVLAEAGQRVTMLEEGQDHAVDTPPHFSREELLHKYRNAGVSVALGRSKLAWVEGRCVGGGSEVNRGIYHRTPEYVLADWRRRFAVDDLDLAGMTPHFEACEAVSRIEFAAARAPEVSRRLNAGARELGWHAVEAPRLYRYGANGEGGERQSMAATFIRRFRAAGGELLASTRVDRVRRSNGRWIVEARRRTAEGTFAPVTFRARRVIVACGAVQTPALLRRSGFTRNVGNSLRFHPMVKLVAEFDREVYRPGEVDPVHQIKEFEPHLGMGCSITRPPMVGMALGADAGNWDLVAERWKRMGIYYVQSGAGIARVRNLPGFRDPFVRIRFTPEEIATLGDGLRRLAHALFAAGAVRVFPGVPGFPALHSPDDIALIPDSIVEQDGAMTSVHVFSSCPMGEDEWCCAADSFGRVHGAQDLYICDASLLCTPTSVNPQGTVMAVAHRNAMAMLERRPN